MKQNNDSFPKIRSWLESLARADHSSSTTLDVLDLNILNSYFEKKAFDLFEIYNFHNVACNYDFLPEISPLPRDSTCNNLYKWVEDNFPFLNNFKGSDVEERMISVMKVHFTEGGNLTQSGLLFFWHEPLAVFALIYLYVKPFQMRLEILFDMELILTEIVFNCGDSIGACPPLIQKWNQAEGVKTGKGKQAKRTDEKIIRTYNLLEPIWSNDNPKKPVKINGLSITINRLGETVRDKMREKHKDVPTQRWIVSRIKQLKKDGKI